MVRSLNQYLEHVKPWEIAKQREKDPEAAGHLEEVLAHAVSTLLQIADLLTPFMPATADAIRNLFESGVVPSGQASPLFPKLYLHTPDPHAPKAN
jgi:methionyl-tRNA synthetase